MFSGQRYVTETSSKSLNFRRLMSYVKVLLLARVTLQESGLFIRGRRVRSRRSGPGEPSALSSQVTLNDPEIGRSLLPEEEHSITASVCLFLGVSLKAGMQI